MARRGRPENTGLHLYIIDLIFLVGLSNPEILRGFLWSNNEEEASRQLTEWVNLRFEEAKSASNYYMEYVTCIRWAEPKDIPRPITLGNADDIRTFLLGKREAVHDNPLFASLEKQMQEFQEER